MQPEYVGKLLSIKLCQGVAFGGNTLNKNFIKQNKRRDI